MLPLGATICSLSLLQLYDWDVMGKEKVATGQSQPIKELPTGEPQDLWVPLELETAEVPGHFRVNLHL